MSRYTATNAMQDSLTASERSAIEQVMTKMRQIDSAKRGGFISQIKATPVVKVGGATLSANAVAYLISAIERMD